MPKEPILTIASLVWNKGKEDGSGSYWSALNNFGFYLIFQCPGEGFDVVTNPFNYLQPSLKTLEEAKALAEAHYQEVMKRGEKINVNT